MAHHEVAQQLELWSEATLAFHRQLIKLNCYPNPICNFSSSLLELTHKPTRDDPYPVVFYKENLSKWRELLLDPAHSQQILSIILDLIPLAEGIYATIGPILDAVADASTNRLVQAKLDELLPFRPYLGIQLIYILRHLLGDVFPLVNQQCQYITYTRASYHLLATYDKQPWLIADTLMDELGHLNIQSFFDIVFEAKDFKLREKLSPQDYETVQAAIAAKQPIPDGIEIPTLFPYEYQVGINNDVISAPFTTQEKNKGNFFDLEKNHDTPTNNNNHNNNNHNNNNNNNKTPKSLLPSPRQLNSRTFSRTHVPCSQNPWLSFEEQFELVPVHMERKLAIALEALFDIIFYFYEGFPQTLPKTERHIPLSLASSFLTIPYTTIQTNELLVTQLNMITQSLTQKSFSQPSTLLGKEHGSVTGIFLHRFLSNCALPITQSPIPSLIQCGVGSDSMVPLLLESVSVYSSLSKHSGNQNLYADHIITHLCHLFSNYIKWTCFRTKQDVRCDAKDMSPFGQIQSQLMLMDFLAEEAEKSPYHHDPSKQLLFSIMDHEEAKFGEGEVLHQRGEGLEEQRENVQEEKLVLQEQQQQHKQEPLRKVIYSPQSFSEVQSPATSLEGVGTITRLFAPLVPGYEAKGSKNERGEDQFSSMFTNYFTQRKLTEMFRKCPELTNQIRMLLLSNEDFLGNIYCNNEVIKESPFRTLLVNFCSSFYHSNLILQGPTDFLLIDLVMEYIFASRETYKANFSRDDDGKVNGFDYDVSPETLSNLHPNTPHPEKWRLWDSDLRLISRYFAAWFGKLQYGFQSLAPSNFFPLVNFYLRGQYGARILQYRSIYKNDARPSKLKFSNVEHYDLYLHPKLTHLFKDTSLNLLPASNEYSIIRQSAGQQHVQIPILFDSHKENIETLHSTLQQFVDVTTSPYYHRCGYHFESLINFGITIDRMAQEDWDQLLASGVCGINDNNRGKDKNNVQALSNSYLYFLHQMVHQNFGENLFLLSSTMRVLNNQKNSLSRHLPAELLTHNHEPSLHLYLNTLSALHKFIFQPNVIVTQSFLKMSQQLADIDHNGKTRNPADLAPNSQKLINGALQQHPIGMTRPLYALYIDTLLYILQGFSYNCFELSRKQHNNQTDLALNTSTPGLSLHSYYQENSSIRKADILTTAQSLERLMKSTVAKKKVAARGKKATKEAPKKIEKRMDSYDYNMNRTKADIGIMRQIDFHISNQNNGLNKTSSSVIKKVTGFDEYQRQYQDEKERDDDAQEEEEEEEENVSPKQPPSEDLSTIPYTTEATSAMVQFCIESFIDLLLVDDIYNIVKTFDFRLKKELPDLVPISQQTQNLIPTLGQLSGTKSTDADFSGLFVEPGYHRYRDYDALHPEEIDGNTEGPFLLNDNLSVSIRNDHNNSNPYALETIKLAKDVQRLDVAIEHQADIPIPYIKNRDNNSAPVVMPSKPQHFGFFYGLPQEELDLLFNATTLANIGFIPGIPLTTNNGQLATRYTDSLHCDYIPVLGINDGNYLCVGEEGAYDPFSLPWKDLVKIDSKGIVENINTLIEEFFGMYPTHAEFTPSSFSKALEDYWGGVQAQKDHAEAHREFDQIVPIDTKMVPDDQQVGDNDGEVHVEAKCDMVDGHDGEVHVEAKSDMNDDDNNSSNNNEDKDEDDAIEPQPGLGIFKFQLPPKLAPKLTPVSRAQNPADDKTKLFSFLQNDDPFGFKLKDSERIAYPSTTLSNGEEKSSAEKMLLSALGLMGAQNGSESRNTQAFVYNHTQSLKPLTAELLIELFETRRDKFTKWE